MIRVGVVTSSRADLGIWLPVLEGLRESARLSAEIIATGMHTHPAHGDTLGELHARGFEVAHTVAAPVHGDGPEATGRAMGEAVAGFARLFGVWRPELLLVLGDRYDMLPAALAALPQRIPVGHLHGGELSEGAIDDSLRHCLTKLSHLHFAATSAYARRLEQLGEERWRIRVTGAPGIDALVRTALLSPDALSERIGLSLSDGFLLVTQHPETLSESPAAAQVGALVAALGKLERPCVITYPNGDPGYRAIVDAIEAYAGREPRVRLVRDAGTQLYASLMATADAMLGNSSSGILEAATFELPVVNVGDRQRGRLRAANVIDCVADTDAIVEATERALDPSFRARLCGLRNPYGDGCAAARIVSALEQLELGPGLTQKRFMDVPLPSMEGLAG